MSLGRAGSPSFWWVFVGIECAMMDTLFGGPLSPVFGKRSILMASLMLPRPFAVMCHMVPHACCTTRLHRAGAIAVWSRFGIGMPLQCAWSTCWYLVGAVRASGHAIRLFPSVSCMRRRFWASHVDVLKWRVPIVSPTSLMSVCWAESLKRVSPGPWSLAIGHSPHLLESRVSSRPVGSKLHIGASENVVHIGHAAR